MPVEGGHHKYQDAISDEEWAYQTKQQIENFLAQHSNGSEIEVLNLTCKQLTCEMLIRAQNVGSWIKILGGLYNELDSEKYYIKSKDMKQLTYPNDEQFFFYQHFVFLNK